MPIFAYQRNTPEYTSSYFQAIFDNLIAQARNQGGVIDNQIFIQDVYKAAVVQHKDESRKSGPPYIIHPLDVNRIIIESSAMRQAFEKLHVSLENIIASALLHDWIETEIKDQKVSRERARKNLAKELIMLGIVDQNVIAEVVFMVNAISKNKGETDKHFISRMLTLIRRAPEGRQRKLLLAAMVIKVADSTSNLIPRVDRTIDEWWPKMKRRRYFINQLTKYLGQEVTNVFLVRMDRYYISPRQMIKNSEKDPELVASKSKVRMVRRSSRRRRA